MSGGATSTRDARRRGARTVVGNSYRDLRGGGHRIIDKFPMSARSKNPVLISSLGYRKAVVRHCTEQIREIEGRLDTPSGVRWEQNLMGCEDLAGVGKLLIALQKRSDFVDADNAWLDELVQLSATDIDDRAIEFTRRVKKRLHDLRASVKYPLEPSTLLGAAVLRAPAEGGGAAGASACRGRVIEHDEGTGFRVLYADGDCEDLPLRELRTVLVRESGVEGDAAGGKISATRSTSGGGAAGAVAAAEPPSGARLSRSGLVLSAAEMKEDVSVQLIFERLEQRHRAAAEAGSEAGGGAAPSAAGGRKKETPPPLPVAEAPRAGGEEKKAPSKKRGRPPASASGSSAAADKEPPSKKAAGGSRAGAPEAAAAPAAASSSAGGSGSGTYVPEASPSAAMAAAAAPAPRRASLPESGLSLVEIEAAAISPGKAASGKRLPRELRNLAIPDRTWNVAMPFFAVQSAVPMPTNTPASAEPEPGA